MICEGGRRKLSSSTWNGGNQLKCPVYVLLWERPPAIVLLILLLLLPLDSGRINFVSKQGSGWMRHWASWILC